MKHQTTIRSTIAKKLRKGFLNHGEMAGIAREVGLSRERVRQIVNGRVPIRSVRKHCKKCGRLTNSKLILCRECRPSKYITLPCGWCGKSVTRLLSQFARSKHSQVCCSIPCRRKWACKYFFNTRKGVR